MPLIPAPPMPMKCALSIFALEETSVMYAPLGVAFIAAGGHSGVPA